MSQQKVDQKKLDKKNRRSILRKKKIEEIAIREVDDLGPVLARADHQDNAIEVNARAFYRLPPMVQEFVLCHEVCHLRHNEWDEARTNALAARLFMSRARSDADRRQRQEFLSYLDGHGGYSNFAWGALISGIVSLGSTVYGIIKQRNSGWYSWDRTTAQSNLDVMLTTAFEESRRSSSKSASDYFWAQMQQYDFKDDSVDKFLSRGDNAWVKPVITKYEKKYGFGFTEVTPIDLTAYPLAIVAIGAVVAFIVYRIIKKTKK